MEFFYYSTNDLLNFLTGDKNISQQDYTYYLDQLFERSDKPENVEIIIKTIRNNLNSNFTEWKNIYKTLNLVDNLIKGASKLFIYEIKNCKELIYVLTKFNYEVNGAENIRNKAKNIYQILESDDLIEKERDDYSFEREKEKKQEIVFQGGLLSRLGRYNFEKDKKEKEINKKKASFKKKKNKYDLTSDNDDSNSSSSDDDNNNEKINENKNMNNKNIPINNNNQNQDLLSFDFTGENKESQVNVNNNGVNLFDFNVQDNEPKTINLQNNPFSMLNNIPNQTNNNNQEYYNPFVEFGNIEQNNSSNNTNNNNNNNNNNNKNNNINLIEF